MDVLSALLATAEPPSATATALSTVHQHCYGFCLVAAVHVPAAVSALRALARVRQPIFTASSCVSKARCTYLQKYNLWGWGVCIRGAGSFNFSLKFKL
jgi:hypothetical protein